MGGFRLLGWNDLGQADHTPDVHLEYAWAWQRLGTRVVTRQRIARPRLSALTTLQGAYEIGLDMASPLEVQKGILDGTTAFGWPYNGAGAIDLDQDPMRGYVRCHKEGHIEFEVLDEDPALRGPLLFEPEAPAMLALSTPHGTGLLLDVNPQVGAAIRIGDGRASVLRYRADSMVSGIDIGEISGGHLASAALRFHGLGDWAGMNSVTTHIQRDGENRVNSATLDLRQSNPEVAKRSLPSNLSLTVQGFWNLSDPGRPPITVNTGVDIEVSAARPRSFGQFLEPLLDCQDLLNLLRGGFVQAEPANVRWKGAGGGSPLLWTRRAMHIPKAALLPKDRLPLHVSLADLGGAAGIARWSNLRRQHPVVVDTVTAPYRSGPDTVETAIIRMGAAIELWVAFHSGKKVAWAKAGKGYAEALARRVGDPFEKWVGSSEKWAAEFRRYYNGSKHHTPMAKDPATLRALAVTGRWLLVCALLDRVAGTKVPSRTILGSPRLSYAGATMREILNIP